MDRGIPHQPLYSFAGNSTRGKQDPFAGKYNVVNMFPSSFPHNQLEPTMSTTSYDKREKEANLYQAQVLSYPSLRLPSIHSVVLPSIHHLLLDSQEHNHNYSNVKERSQSVLMIQNTEKRSSSSGTACALPYQKQLSPNSKQIMHVQDRIMLPVLPYSNAELDQQQSQYLVAENDPEEKSSSQDNNMSSKNTSTQVAHSSCSNNFGYPSIMKSVSTHQRGQTTLSHFKLSSDNKEDKSCQKRNKKYFDMISYNNKFFEDSYVKKTRRLRSTNGVYRNKIVFDEEELSQ